MCNVGRDGEDSGGESGSKSYEGEGGCNGVAPDNVLKNIVIGIGTRQPEPPLHPCLHEHCKPCRSHHWDLR